MSEFGKIPREIALQLMRDEQNRIADQEREAFLAEHLFHIGTAVKPDAVEFLKEVRKAFLDEKDGKNMGELFALATQEQYLGVISVVELGVSRHPGNDGEVDALKGQYNDFKDWLQKQRIIDNEIGRQQSGRTLEIRKSKIVDDLVTVVRTRPLIKAETEIPMVLHDGTDVTEKLVPIRFQVAKQMMFGIPAKLYYALSIRYDDPFLEKEVSISTIEDLMATNSKMIEPIRTSYYLGTELSPTKLPESSLSPK